VEYGLVLMVSLSNTVYLTITQMTSVFNRYKYLNQAYIDTYLTKETALVKADQLRYLKKDTKPVGISRGCYPDNGQGPLAQYLPLDQWFALNISQSVAAHFNESFAQFQLVLLLSGLAFPRLSVFVGSLHLIGRILYSRGYKSKRRGTQGKMTGFVIVWLSCCVLLVGASYTALAMSFRYLYMLATSPALLTL